MITHKTLSVSIISVFIFLIIHSALFADKPKDAKHTSSYRGMRMANADGLFYVTKIETEIEQAGIIEKNTPDLVLLDIMLPQLNGLEVLRRIRKTSNTPVIMLTARGDTFDKVSGLDSGADDYLAKPFEIEELLARMRAVIRRNNAQEITPLKLRGIELNPNSMEVTVNKERVMLSKTEYLLLKTLLEHKNTVLSRDTIINTVWGADHYIDENSVDVYVRYLRAKIDDKTGEEYISTVRGVGYVMRDIGSASI